MLKLFLGHIGLVKDPIVFQTWFENMDSIRKEKILGCKHPEDKQRSLMAGILLQYGLKQLDSYENVYYSISHSGEYAICAVSDHRVGVDLENSFRDVFAQAQMKQLEQIGKKCLTEHELSQFLSLGEEEKADAFVFYWTRKESYSKALGKGLGMDFKSIDTQAMEECYWSGWIKDGYFCSVYAENEKLDELLLEELEEL